MANKKGATKVAGRVKGTPNKLTVALKDMILGALNDAGGQTYLSEQAISNPVAFMALIGRCLPLAVTGPDGGPAVFIIKDA